MQQLTFECGIIFDILPTAFSHAPELLDPKLDMIKVKEVADYLRHHKFNTNKIFKRISVRALVEYDDLEKLDLLLYKMTNMRLLDAAEAQNITMKHEEVLDICYKVPELLVPSILDHQDVDRTIQLCGRHLTTNLSALYVLLKFHPRELFYERTLPKYYNSKQELGIIQPNWKLLSYDMQIDSDEIIFKHLHLLVFKPRQLQIRSHFLRLQGQLNLLQDIELMRANDEDFCNLCGFDIAEYNKYVRKYFL